MRWRWTWFNLLCLLWHFSSCLASRGDNSYPYQKCLRICLDSRCRHPSGHASFLSAQPLHRRLLGWDCDAECRHDCTWEAVDVFVREGSSVPQFHGKWPFTRVLGVQEPVSALASVLNGLAHVAMLRRLARRVPSAAPFFKLWRFFGFVCINAWFWSFVFHVRDTPWTERFDYFSAFSLILVQLFCCLVRIFGPASSPALPRFLGSFFALVFARHCLSMSLVKFDYGYNMKVNVIFAAVNALAWIAFSVYQMRLGHAHFRKVLLATLWFSSSALLETLDFPPVLAWSVDSHALWHLSTAPLPVLFYDFVVDDALDLLKKRDGLDDAFKEDDDAVEIRLEDEWKRD